MISPRTTVPAPPRIDEPALPPVATRETPLETSTPRSPNTATDRMAAVPRRAHLVGICGTGMKALAELLSGLGSRISGSDLQLPGPLIRAMERRGLRVHSGHHDRFLPEDVEAVIHSAAIGPDNPERRLATRLGIPQFSYSRMLGRLMESRTGVAIAGTHGKSTTTALTAMLLEAAGSSPSAVVGAELIDRNASGWAGSGDLFVVESCEYQRSFLDLRPKFAAITGIEPDHFDYFRDPDDMHAAFAQFAAQVADDGWLLVNADCPASVACARAAKSETATFSLTDAGADWWIADPRRTQTGTWHRVFHRGEFFADVCLRLPGRHNAANALAAIALADRAGASREAIREGIHEFSGVRRRFETAGSWRGIALVDDYAHHPTAVAATLAAARERFGPRRIWCAFQPHQVSRTRALFEEFAGSFSRADEVLVAPVFAAREAGDGERDAASRELAERIAERGTPARFRASLDQLRETVEDEARPGDVLILMGAGDIDQVRHEFTRRLQRHHAAG
ncbi:MAG: UDP-N-acetylmuramate--L-alanine ligase [Planctomycetaceae bacterium]